MRLARCAHENLLQASLTLPILTGSKKPRGNRNGHITNCLALRHVIEGGAEKPSRSLPGVHETAPHPRHLNEGTGSLSRSFRLDGLFLRLRRTSTKGPGVYPGHHFSAGTQMNGAVPQRRDREFIPVIALRMHDWLSMVPTSTKGPGVYPSHNATGVLIGALIGTSTKGPGVYPSHLAVAWAHRRLPRPQRRDREFIPVIQVLWSSPHC